MSAIEFDESDSDSELESESDTENVMKDDVIQYHPRYTQRALDNFTSNAVRPLEVLTADGITFCLHPLLMRMASSVFNDMLNSALDDGDMIRINEDADVFAALIDIISPNVHSGLGTISSVSFAARVLRAAEKYDFQKVVQIFQENIISFPLFKKDPIVSYGIACDLGWAVEACLLSTETLQLDLRSSESLKKLENLYPKDILRLQSLHSIRCRLLSKSMTCVEVKAINTSTEQIYGIRVLSLWKDKHEQSLTALKYLVMTEMEKCPAASTLQGAFWARPEVSKLFQDDNWRKDYVASEVHRMIPLLPSSIKELDTCKYMVNYV